MPQGAPAPKEAMPLGPRFWHPGQSIRVVRRGLPASSKAWGKVPTVELPPPEVDKELVLQPQQEKVAAEKAQLGWDTATLEVVMEATGPLNWG